MNLDTDEKLVSIARLAEEDLTEIEGESAGTSAIPAVSEDVDANPTETPDTTDIPEEEDSDGTPPVEE